MISYYLQLTLQSDATFGRGEGVPGLVDEEVEHDQFGLPFLHGRTLKGLLVEECANILYSLKRQGLASYADWEQAANRLFGEPGTTAQETAKLHIGHARLPQDLQEMVRYHAHHKHLNRTDVLESLTDIRRQTAMDETGQPAEGSLRSMRVVLRQTTFTARLRFRQPPTTTELALLNACALAFRRAGVGRNRGRGHLQAVLLDDSKAPVNHTHFQQFKEAITR